MHDVLVDAVLPDVHKPILQFQSAHIKSNDGNEYKIVDQFNRNNRKALLLQKPI